MKPQGCLTSRGKEDFLTEVQKRFGVKEVIENKDTHTHTKKS